MRKIQGILYSKWQLNVIVRPHPIGTIRFRMPLPGAALRYMYSAAPTQYQKQLAQISPLCTPTRLPTNYKH